MNNDRWTAADRLFDAALDRKPHERAEFLREACAGDAELQRAVESLLENEREAGRFLDTPALELIAERHRRPGSAPLAPGARLGPYEIEVAIGAGGMGEVYRARDTRLNRAVALKVLPELFATDADRLARFEREAQVLASFNHPNIGAIHGIEEGPTRAGHHVRALVLELVEGPTLAERIARGPMPLDEALPIARQIADALEAAHEHGIVHRDLKPANVKLRPDGMVKVLDFGLAKALAPVKGGPSISNSPTMMASMPGMLLGTAAYMAPEQAKGQEAGRRADVWAFGCVLFEMLAGTRAFEGDTTNEVLANVLKIEPAWSRMPAEMPASINRLLRRCLQKDPKLRLRDIGDARLEIDDARSEPSSPLPTAATTGRSKERLAWSVVVAVVALVAIIVGKSMTAPTAVEPVQFEIATPPAQDPVDVPSFAISPDGRKLVFAGSSEGQPQLWLRFLDSVVSRPIAGTEGALLPFWSADSRSVAFVADSQLKRVDLDGGLVRPLTGAAGAGGTWNHENVILFPPVPASPILRISAEGGTPTDVTRLDSSHAGHLYPHFLPDGRHFTYYVQGTPESRGVYVGQLEEAAPRKLFDADSPAVYASGHLLFIRQATLFAHRFDAQRLQLEGRPFAVAEGVLDAFSTSRYATLSASAGGNLAFRVGAFKADKQFAWFDRAGRNLGTVGDPDAAGPLSPTMSHDGNRVALMRRAEGNADIWSLDLRRGVLSRLTNHPAEDVFPVLSPDGSRMAFLSNRGGKRALYEKSTTRSDAEELPIVGGEGCLMNDWSRDDFLLCERAGAETTLDLWAVPLRGDRKPFAVVQTQSRDRNGQFSPDGKWVAYESRTSGRTEVYIQAFPDPGAPSRVSTGGGAQVRWRPDGRELFYVALDGKLMAVPIRVEADGRSLDIGLPQPLFTTRIGRVLTSVIGAQYVVSADGQRFLMNAVVPSGGPTPIRLILNWNPAAQRLNGEAKSR